MAKPKSSKLRSKYLSKKIPLSLPGTGKKPLTQLFLVEPASTREKFFRCKQDVKEGTELECASCANAIGGQRAGIADLMFFHTSRAYGAMTDRKGNLRRGKDAKGQTWPVVKVWMHGQGKFQEEFDKDKDGLLASPRAEGWVSLRPFRFQQNPGGGSTGGGGTHKPRSTGNRLRWAKYRVA